MIVNFMTKPTQGAAFKRYRDHLMGVTKAQDSGLEDPKSITKIKKVSMVISPLGIWHPPTSNYVHKASRNAAPTNRSVLE